MSFNCASEAKKYLCQTGCFLVAGHPFSGNYCIAARQRSFGCTYKPDGRALLDVSAMAVAAVLAAPMLRARGRSPSSGRSCDDHDTIVKR
jgi:hypothetical protein